MIKKYTAPCIAALCVILLLVGGVLIAQRTRKSVPADQQLRSALQTAILADVSLSARTRDLLVSTLSSEDNAFPLRKRVLTYALMLHEAELSTDQRSVVRIALKEIIGEHVETNVFNNSQVLLDSSPIDESRSLELSDSDELGIDPGLTNSPALLPISPARIQRYASAPILPDRNELYVSRVKLQSNVASDFESQAQALFHAEQDDADLALIPPLRPYPVSGQIAELNANILDIQPRPLSAKLKKIPEPQSIVLPNSGKIAEIATRFCSPSVSIRNSKLSTGDRTIITKELSHIQFYPKVYDSIGCTGQSLLISNEESENPENNWILVLSPSRKASGSGILFNGIAPTFAIEEVGTSENSAVYIARQTGGSGGMLNSLVIDLMRSRILASIEMLPDGELHYFLKSGHGPKYLLVRQSAITSERSVRNAAPKRTLTAILRLDSRTSSYRILNLRLSRRSRNMDRTGYFHNSQIPGLAAKMVCGLPDQPNKPCETAPEALFAEAQARRDAGDPQGAIRFYDEFIRKVEARAYVSNKEELGRLLGVMLEDAVALFASQQYGRLAALCEHLDQTAWVATLGKDAVDQKTSTCENLLGMSARIRGNYAAAGSHFEKSQIADNQDPAPFGNSVLHRIDVNQPRQALGMLLEHLFDIDAKKKYTEHQRLQFAQALASLNHSSLASLFLRPNEKLTLPMFGISLSVAGRVSYETGDNKLSLALLDESLHYLDSYSLQDLGSDIILSYARILSQGARESEANFMLDSLLDPDVEVALPIRAKAYDLLAEMTEKRGDTSLAFSWAQKAVTALQYSLPDQQDHERYFSSLLGSNRPIIERWFALARSNKMSAEDLHKWSFFWKSSPAFQDPSSTPLPQLHTQECTFDFLKVVDELWRFSRCGQQATTIHKVPKDYREIVKLVADLRQGRVINTLTLKGKVLSNLLFDKISVAKIKRLYVISDIGLNEVPWTALAHPSSDSYLIDSVKIIQYYPGNFPARFQRAPSPKINIIASAGLAHASDGTILPPLKEVPLEISAITEAWHSDSVSVLADFTGKSHSRKSWRSSLSDGNILHVAAHGERNLSQPDLSQIIFSDALHGERITPRSLDETNLGNLDVAVLNVCSTGYMRAGDTFGDTGFRTMLLRRGAASVIDAGWEINDERSAQFAKAFYSDLAQGARLEDAFFDAIGVTRRSNSDPGSWGAYSLSVRDPGIVNKIFYNRR